MKCDLQQTPHEEVIVKIIWELENGAKEVYLLQLGNDTGQQDIEATDRKSCWPPFWEVDSGCVTVEWSGARCVFNEKKKYLERQEDT